MRLVTFIFTWIFAGTAFSAETPWPTAAWQTATTEEQGISSGALADLIDTVGTSTTLALVRSRSGFVRAWDSVEYALCPARGGVVAILMRG